MKTTSQKHSANSDECVLSLGPPFSLVNALVYVQHRPGHSLGKQLDKGMGINFFSKSDSVVVIDNENKSR